MFEFLCPLASEILGSISSILAIVGLDGLLSPVISFIGDLLGFLISTQSTYFHYTIVFEVVVVCNGCFVSIEAILANDEIGRSG